MELRYREGSVSVQLDVYCGAVCYCGTESCLLVCSWLCIVERCGIVLQRAVCLVSPAESHGDSCMTCYRMCSTAVLTASCLHRHCP
jgi:hypothetical protein